MSCHRAAPFYLALVQCACVSGSRVVTHLLERPGKIHRGRASGCELGRRLVQVSSELGCQRDGICSRDADRRCAADRKLVDRIDDLRNRSTLELDLLIGKPTLVEEDDPRAVLLVPNDVLWF
jgi:hypothetical protein